MWQRFTERARRVILLGQEEAGKMGSSHVGTEHLLLGLMRESEGAGALILERAGITSGVVRAEIETTPDTDKINPEPKLTRMAKQVLELAVDEARRFRHDYIGTEHLLLGLLREKDGLAASVLGKLGLELKTARVQVVDYLSSRAQSVEGDGLPKARVREFQERPRHSESPTPPWVRFSDLARRAILLGQHKAGRLGSAEVGSEHILFGLLCLGEGFAVEVLRKLNVTAERVGEELGADRTEGLESVGDPSLAAEAKKALSWAAAEATALNHKAIGTEHLLLGYLRSEENPAAAILAKFEVKAEDLKHLLTRKMSQDTIETKQRRIVQDQLVSIRVREEITKAPPKDRFVFREELHKTIVAATDVAVEVGGERTSLEHFLLALFQQPPERVERILTECGLNLEQAKARLLQELEGVVLARDTMDAIQLESQSEQAQQQ